MKRNLWVSLSRGLASAGRSARHNDRREIPEQPGRSVSAEPTRRRLLAGGLGLLLGSHVESYSADNSRVRLNIANYYSRLNRRRPRRSETRYIILHTTEGGESGSLRKIHRRGEAHYFVTEKGKIFRIIHKSKIAAHSGRSMWDGRNTIDNSSVGIEVVGYHNQDIKPAQYTALRELIRQLKSYYDLTDQQVLTHSMVAYGRPNRFHKNRHRGRKRCAMIFSRHDVRQRLGLGEKPLTDPDVDAGRLVVADPELHAFLYAPPPPDAAAPLEAPEESNIISSGRTAWHIARERYNDALTLYIFPGGDRRTGAQITDWSRIPVGTRVVTLEAQEDEGFEGFTEIGKDGDTAQQLAGDAYDDSSTIYFLPNGFVRTGSDLKRQHPRLLGSLPAGTRVLVGYIYGGHVSKSRLPKQIASFKWNYPSTYYRFPSGQIVSGDDIDPANLPARTLIFYQR